METLDKLIIFFSGAICGVLICMGIFAFHLAEAIRKFWLTTSRITPLEGKEEE